MPMRMPRVDPVKNYFETLAQVLQDSLQLSGKEVNALLGAVDIDDTGRVAYLPRIEPAFNIVQSISHEQLYKSHA